MEQRRRRLLKLSGIALAGSMAGCSAAPGDGTETTETTADDATPTETQSPTSGGTETTGTPGNDVLGGSNDLQSSASVRAAALDEDQGNGKFVFSPAVVWIESGASVEWTMEGVAHSATAYHPDNDDHPLRVPEDAAAFDSGTLEAGEPFSHSFERPGVYNYYCKPHEGLGMVGLVVVDGPQGGPGTKPVEAVSGTAGSALSRLLETAGVAGAGGDGSEQQTYAWSDATWDSYWYSLYNMSTNIAMSGNGVLFPHNEQQQQAFDQRVPAMLKHADVDRPPIKNPNLNMAAFTEGDPHFTQKPVLSGPDGRPDASTLQWDMSTSSKTVSPTSLAWTHLKGVTWAKNFQNHFDVLPKSLAAKFRAQMLTTLAQIGVNAALIVGGPEGNGALTKGESMELVSGFVPGMGEVVDDTARPNHHSAMLWFLSDLNSLAQNGWFGYVNPEPLVPAEKLQTLTDGMGKTTMELFTPADVVAAGSTRDLGQMLGAMGWYGTHAGDADLAGKAATYANDLAAEVEANLESSGRLSGGAENQAATQGAVGQGLLWASELDGVDHADAAEQVLTYMVETLWDDEAGTYASGEGDSTYRITSRDAGDITGGVNALDAVLGTDVKAQYATFFNQTFNRGMLQRAERPQSRDAGAEYTLPLPPKAGGEFGQAAVYNNAVEYDTGSGEWSVVDDLFTTADALYTANQDIWISQWGGDFFQGRGVPGKSDAPK